MKAIKRTLIVLAPLVLTGCGYFSQASFIQNKDKAYLSAKSIPPLRTPPGIASSSFHNAYPVSDKQYSEAAKDVSIAPPGLNMH